MIGWGSFFAWHPTRPPSAATLPLRGRDRRDYPLLRRLVCELLHLHVDELQRVGGLLQHAPALEPCISALHLLEWDRRRIDHDDAAFAQVLDLERGDARLLGMVVEE